MKKLIMLLIFVLFFTGCKTLPLKGIYTKNIAQNKEIKTLESGFDISYSIDFNMAQKTKDDYVSFTLINTVHKYRLDFYANNEIKKIISDFIAINEQAVKSGYKDGTEIIGISLLYCYVFQDIESDDNATRLDAALEGKNAVQFGFLVKNKIPYLVLKKFHVKKIYGKQEINDNIESIAFYYDDIKKLYDFMNDADSIENIRLEKISEALEMEEVPAPPEPAPQPINP